MGIIKLRRNRVAVLIVLIVLALIALWLLYRYPEKEPMLGVQSQAVQSEGKAIRAPSSKIVRYDTDALAPFLWLMNVDLALTQESLQNVAAIKDPLRVFSQAFRLLREYDIDHKHEYRVAAKRALDFMLDSYEPAERGAKGSRWFYGFPYEGIPTNWWSGMDHFFGPLTFYAGWEEFGELRYREEAIRSAKLALRSPLEGGVLWRNGDSCWISEYA